MSDLGKVKFDELWEIMRELYRNYTAFSDHYHRYGRDTIQVGPVMLSFLDLQYGVKELPPRQKEAFFYNVILDMKQREVEQIMGITTVSVGQYVKSACQQLARRYFDEAELWEISQYMLAKREKGDSDESDSEEERVEPDERG